MSLSEQIRCVGKPTLFVTAIIVLLTVLSLGYYMTTKNRRPGPSPEEHRVDEAPAQSRTTTSQQEPNTEPTRRQTAADDERPAGLSEARKPVAAAPPEASEPSKGKEQQQKPAAGGDKPQAADSPQAAQAQVKPADSTLPGDAPRPVDLGTPERPTAAASLPGTPSDPTSMSRRQTPHDSNDTAGTVEPEDSAARQETPNGPDRGTPAVTVTAQGEGSPAAPKDSPSARSADPNAVEPKRSAAELYLQADALLRRHGISGPAPLRLASSQVAALDQAGQILKQVSKLDPNHAPCREAMALVEKWDQSRRRPPSLLLSRLPDHSTLVVYADVKALRLWPGLVGMVNAWIESPELTGATASLRDTLQTLATRPLEAGDSLCVWISEDPLRGGQICCLGHTQLEWQSLSQAVAAHFKATPTSENSLSFGRYTLQNLGDGLIAWGSDTLVESVSQSSSGDTASAPPSQNSLWAAASQPADAGDIWLAAAPPFGDRSVKALRACGVADSNTVEAVSIRACADDQFFQVNATLFLIEIVDSEEAAQRLRRSIDDIVSESKKSTSALHRQVGILIQKTAVVAGERRVEGRLRLPSSQWEALVRDFDNQRRR